MPKALNRVEARHLANLVSQIPAPTPSDIAKVQIGALECRSMKQFCEFMQVEPVIFKHWVNTNIQFRKAYRSWRDHASEEVEMALAKKAVGFTKRTRKQILTRAGVVETLVNEEYFPPDTTAAGMWLRNRNGKDWKDTQNIDINVQTNIRAWLVNAMEDAPSDDSEVIDVTPTLKLEDKLEPTVIENAVLDTAYYFENAVSDAPNESGEPLVENAVLESGEIINEQQISVLSEAKIEEEIEEIEQTSETTIETPSGNKLADIAALNAKWS